MDDQAPVSIGNRRPPAPSAEEVRAAAALLGVAPDAVSSFKLPGPGSLGESMLTGWSPRLDGFNEPEHLRAEWDVEGERVSHPAALYTGGDGNFLAISHERGPELYFALVGAGASAIAVIDGVRRFLTWCLDQRRGSQRGTPWADVRAVRRTFDLEGRVLTEEEVEIRLRPDEPLR